jgi:hypothetical protein
VRVRRHEDAGEDLSVAAGWLKDRPFDLTLIFGVTALACAMGGSVAVEPALFVPMLSVHAWFFSFDHVASTYTRLAGRREDRQRHRFLLFGLPLLLFTAIFLAGQRHGIEPLASAYFLFQWFHTTRQSWGIAQHYRRAAGGLPSEPRWFSEVTLWSLPVWGLLNRCQQQPGRFLSMDLWLPPVPGAVVDAAGALSVLLVTVYFFRKLRALRRGESSIAHALYMATHLLVFALAYLVIDDLHAGWLIVNVWHNVQYLAYVWLQNRARFGENVRDEAPILSWLCRGGGVRAFAYFAALLAISVPVFTAIYAATDRVDLWLDGKVISFTLVVALTVNFHHYVADAVIWRRPRTAAT